MGFKNVWLTDNYIISVFQETGCLMNTVWWKQTIQAILWLITWRKNYLTTCKSHHKIAIKKQKLTSILSQFYPYRRTNAQSLLLEINIWPPPPISCHWSLFITLRKRLVVWNKLPIYVKTPQNGQTHSYNSSAASD